MYRCMAHRMAVKRESRKFFSYLTYSLFPSYVFIIIIIIIIINIIIIIIIMNFVEEKAKSGAQS